MENNDSILELIQKMIDDVKFGQIVIVVQDGKVVQLEQSKKIRIK